MLPARWPLVVSIVCLLECAAAQSKVYALAVSKQSLTCNGGTTPGLFGPSASAYSYTWSQYITPVTIGTVLVSVDQIANRTSATTVYNDEATRTSTLTMLKHTNVNDKGSVVATVTGMDELEHAVTYPTPYFEIGAEFAWRGYFPSVLNNNRTTCAYTTISSPTPSHAAFQRSGYTDQEDPRGWLYTLTGASSGGPIITLPAAQVSSLWMGQDLTIPYTSCSRNADQSTDVVVALVQTATRVDRLLTSSSTSIHSSSAQAVNPVSVTALPFSASAESTTVTDFLFRSEMIVPALDSSISRNLGDVDFSAQSSTVFVTVSSVPSTPPGNYAAVLATTTTTITSPALPPFRLGSSTITADSESHYMVGLQTLSPGGPAITIAGTLLSLAPSATELVVGTSSDGLVSGAYGVYIWSGLGGSTRTEGATLRTSSAPSSTTISVPSATAKSGAPAQTVMMGIESSVLLCLLVVLLVL